jgi:hypothetical protein
MLAEMLEMLAQMLGQMLGPLRCWLRCLRCLAQMLGPLRCWLLRLSADDQQMSADVGGLGRCYWQMLADDAGLADVASRMVQRLNWPLLKSHRQNK